MNRLKVPHLVFYTDKLFKLFGKDWAEGMAIFFFVLIRPEHKSDQGLYEHEKVHVLQFWRTLGLHGIVYKLSVNYRYRAELEAYRRQLRFSSAPSAAVKVFAGYIVENYKLDSLKLTKAAVIRALKGQ